MQLFLHKLAPAGVVCYHTSSRTYDLTPPLADTAHSLGLACRRGHDRRIVGGIDGDIDGVSISQRATRSREALIVGNDLD